MRAAALAVAIVAGFLGVMYVRFSGDTVPAPEATVTPAPGQVSINDRCEGYVRYPRPRQCEGVREPLWWTPPSVPPTRPPAPPVPDALKEAGIVALEFGPEIELPSDLALIIPPTCGNCESPSGGYSRVYRDSAGQIRTDALITIESLGLSPASDSHPDGAHFTGFAADEDGSPMAVSVCRIGPCFNQPGRPMPEGADSAILISNDGGIDWSELDAPAGVLWVSGVLPDGRVVVAEPNDKPEPPLYRIVPGGEILTPPAAGYAVPLALGNGEIVWATENEGIRRTDGSRWFGDWADPSQLQFMSKFVFDPGRDRALSPATVLPRTGIGPGFLTIFRRDGSLERVYSVPGFVSPLVWLDDRRVLVSADACAGKSEQPYVACSFGPAIIDLESQLIQPIRPFLDLPLLVSEVLAVQRGPLARVVNTGACLNVYREPQADGRVIGCFKDGVLLRDISDGSLFLNEWVQVVVPGGEVGWASAQYLER